MKTVKYRRTDLHACSDLQPSLLSRQFAWIILPILETFIQSIFLFGFFKHLTSNSLTSFHAAVVLAAVSTPSSISISLSGAFLRSTPSQLFLKASLEKKKNHTVSVWSCYIKESASAWTSRRRLFCVQVLWEMLTREVPFKGFEGLQVAWLVVEKQEVTNANAHMNTPFSPARCQHVGPTRVWEGSRNNVMLSWFPLRAGEADAGYF